MEKTGQRQEENSTIVCTAVQLRRLASGLPVQMSDNTPNERSLLACFYHTFIQILFILLHYPFYVTFVKHHIEYIFTIDKIRCHYTEKSCNSLRTAWNFHNYKVMASKTLN